MEIQVTFPACDLPKSKEVAEKVLGRTLSNNPAEMMRCSVHGEHPLLPSANKCT